MSAQLGVDALQRQAVMDGMVDKKETDDRVNKASSIRKSAGPGPGRPKRAEVERRNHELLDRALDLFLDKGFEKTTIDEIAIATGMAKRTIYFRYSDKLTLFKASLQRAIDAWVVPVEKLHAAECDDLESTLIEIAHILIANVTSPAGLRLMWVTNAEAHRVPEVGAYAYQAGTKPTVTYLQELFCRRGLYDASQEVELKYAAHAFLNLLLGATARLSAWGTVIDADTIQASTAFRVRLFLNGIRPRE